MSENGYQDSTIPPCGQLNFRRVRGALSIWPWKDIANVCITIPRKLGSANFHVLHSASELHCRAQGPADPEPGPLARQIPALSSTLQVALEQSGYFHCTLQWSSRLSSGCWHEEHIYLIFKYCSFLLFSDKVVYVVVPGSYKSPK